MRVKVEVCKNNIKKGVQGDTCECAIAKAVKRLVKKCWHPQVSVPGDCV